MKLQHLAIIFVIIIVPISLVLSIYTGNNIKTIRNQTTYDSSLINSTYDAMKAFQLNTTNNTYSTIGNSKIRDIEASISTLYNSLATNFGTSGYVKEDLQGYTPAILFALYDGYYIYSSYYDTVEEDYVYGLKPNMFYSCRYIKGDSYDFSINYTLDNTITVIGKVKGNYVTKTGHLVSTSENYGAEVLSENLIVLNDTDNLNPSAESYQYIVYNNQKIYKENNQDYFNDSDSNSLRHRYFYYSSAYKKDYINNVTLIDELNGKLDGSRNLTSNSASSYYVEAVEFTNWVNNNLSEITAEDAVDANGNKITDFAVNTGSQKIFKIDSNNNPLASGSIFNEHRMSVIRKSIETNLVSAIANYSRHSLSGFEFVMPTIGEEEWYKIENNITIVSFLQGMPIGSKIYNNYCVISNDANQEMVGADSIYLIDSNGEYHKPGCKTLLAKIESGAVTVAGAYSSGDFQRKKVSLTGEDANAGAQLTGTDETTYAYYYPQVAKNYASTATACYDCIVTISDTNSIDDILNGKINNTIRTWYMRALARCRYDLYITNGYFGI